MAKNLLDDIKQTKFGFKHITGLLVILIVFQIVLSFVQKSSLHNFLEKTQKWYQRDSAERLANLSTISLELIIENSYSIEKLSEENKRKIVQSFNIILSQQLLQQNVEKIALLMQRDTSVYVIRDGSVLYDFLYDHEMDIPHNHENNEQAVHLFKPISEKLRTNEEIYSVLEGEETFHIFVPFIPLGEYLGVLYMRNTPDFQFITGEIISSYDEVAIIYSSLILLVLLAIYYITSYTLQERDETQKKLFAEHEKNLKQQIMHQKESLFTKRIYHTHHKAEKVMGFIKEDLRKLSDDNIEEIKYRVSKYSNFMSRVIYDMKWYDPPLYTIRNPLFKTDINEVIKFIVKNIFLRISAATASFDFKLDLDEKVPSVKINEFVVWEIFEPLMQNAIDHADIDNVVITVTTEYFETDDMILVKIEDNGKGINPGLLEQSQEGVKKIFSENVSTKEVENKSSGYGCYIAYEMAGKRCGWDVDAENKPEGGARFIIVIPNP